MNDNHEESVWDFGSVRLRVIGGDERADILFLVTEGEAPTVTIGQRFTAADEPVREFGEGAYGYALEIAEAHARLLDRVRREARDED